MDLRFWGILLLLLLLVLQYRIWLDEKGVGRLRQMEEEIIRQQALNRQLEACNRQLRAEVIDLKQGQEALEERARSDLGMVRPGEIFVPLIGHGRSLPLSHRHSACEEVTP